MSDPYASFSDEPLDSPELRRVRKLLQDQRDRETYARGGERLKTVAAYIAAGLSLIAVANLIAPGALGRIFGG